MKETLSGFLYGFPFRIKHKGELVGKSTATHARILAPDDVTIHVYPVSLIFLSSYF